MYFADIGMFTDKKILLFDVGANKGYSISNWLSIWMPHLGINPETLGEFLRNELKLYDCGVCNDCKQTISIDAKYRGNENTTMEIYAFEPQPSSYKMLRQIRAWMNVSFLNLHQMAISNQSEIRALKKCSRGIEQCTLELTSNISDIENYIMTKVTTLDEFISERNISQKIDLLKIDTEGFDPLVIQGAENILQRHQVRLIIFEYHGIGIWQTTTLYQVIINLDQKGYLCYQLGQTGIFRLTGCWSSKFEIKHWSNILCTSRDELRLISFIEKLLIVR